MDPTVATTREIKICGGRLTLAPKDEGETVRVDIRDVPVVIGRDPGCALTITDRGVSAVHAELVATPQGVRVRDLGSKNGTWIGGARIQEAYLVAGAVLTIGPREVAFEPISPNTVSLPRTDRLGRLHGQSALMRTLYAQVERVAPTDLTVLIQGETGTGKELVAQAIHEGSPRNGHPFVVVDCGAISPQLAESTLFGHERGAFTGAVQKRMSPFLEAEGGTVFLDELGELPVDVQPKLLRALAERRVQAVGGSGYRPFDARIVAATRRDLVAAVNAGTFRSDLYFRVAHVRITAPPLRDRLEDLSLLVGVLAGADGPSVVARLGSDGLARLLRYDWPGNVRELRNAVLAAIALSEPGGPVDIAGYLEGSLGQESSSGSGFAIDPHPPPPSSTGTSPLELTYHDAKRAALDRFERAYFSVLRATTGGNIAEISRRAGLQRTHVRRYMKAHGLLVPRRSRDSKTDDDAD